MPIYLCKAGAGAPDPWRHGIQVYDRPFPINLNNPAAALTRETTTQSENNVDEHSTSEWNYVTSEGVQQSSNPQQQTSNGSNNQTSATDNATSLLGTNPATVSMANTAATAQTAKASFSSSNYTSGMPIRRVRHSEVVLVDDVCIAYGRYWLRLRWPGCRGGFAGYIAMGLLSDNSWDRRAMQTMANTGAEMNFCPSEDAESIHREGKDVCVALHSSVPEERLGTEDSEVDDPTRDDDPPKSAEPYEPTAPIMCLRTGIAFPTSTAMELMIGYDDGLSPPVASAPFPTEPVFCRICREDLHDDADVLQPSGEVEDINRRNPAGTSSGQESLSQNESTSSLIESLETSTKGPVQPHPSYQTNPHVAENPLLAPCECSGSMAYVHYLCVEQWRCRSRHPEARHGLQCETCGGAYSLPPPSVRHSRVAHVEVEDWLDAMPPHVMAALRNPHVGWQIGVRIVTQRWLRPIAPVIMSPLFALYCRARRFLKKRGVARRRWACSLCGRRARWKCVRCLRSYYCSRQCQNVSWHIVHKHFCFKPVRFWWSVVVYGVGAMLAFPGIIRDPFFFDLGLCVIPASFVIMAILGGGLATLLKKSVGIDLRGRIYECVALLLTLWLVVISWGVVGGFFGDSSKCYGVTGPFEIPAKDISSNMILNFAKKFILNPAQTYYLFWDKLASKSHPWFRKALCVSSNENTGEGTKDSIKVEDLGCFERLPQANANFFVKESNGQNCASDFLLIMWLYIAAGFALVGQSLWKRRERQRRARRQQFRAGIEIRPHQD